MNIKSLGALTARRITSGSLTLALMLSITADQTVTQAQEASENSRITVADFVGKWGGRWKNNARSLLIVYDGEPLEIRYCYKGRCWWSDDLINVKFEHKEIWFRIRGGSDGDTLVRFNHNGKTLTGTFYVRGKRYDVEVKRLPFTDPKEIMEKVKEASLKKETYHLEGKDWKVPQKTEYRTERFEDNRTPRFHPLARTINTKELLSLITDENPPVIIDPRGHGKPEVKGIPSSVILQGIGLSKKQVEDIDTASELILEKLTNNDKTRAIIFSGWDAKTWYSYNASMRAIKHGYKNVYWYRGGIKAWEKARLPMEWVNPKVW